MYLYVYRTYRVIRPVQYPFIATLDDISLLLHVRSIFIFPRDEIFSRLRPSHKPYEDVRSKCRDWLFIGTGPVHSVFM